MKKLSAKQITKFNQIIEELEQYQITNPLQKLRLKKHGIRSSQIGALILFLIERQII